MCFLQVVPSKGIGEWLLVTQSPSRNQWDAGPIFDAKILQLIVCTFKKTKVFWFNPPLCLMLGVWMDVTPGITREKPMQTQKSLKKNVSIVIGWIFFGSLSISTQNMGQHGTTRCVITYHPSHDVGQISRNILKKTKWLLGLPLNQLIKLFFFYPLGNQSG